MDNSTEIIQVRAGFHEEVRIQADAAVCYNVGVRRALHGSGRWCMVYLVGTNWPTAAVKLSTRRGTAKNVRVSSERKCRERSCRSKILGRCKWIERSFRVRNLDLDEWSRYSSGTERERILFEGGMESRNLNPVRSARPICETPNMSAYYCEWRCSVLRLICL